MYRQRGSGIRKYYIIQRRKKTKFLAENNQQTIDKIESTKKTI